MSDHNRVTVTTEGPTPLGWPESMKVVASTTTAFGAIGHAVILEGRLPDFYRHHWPDAALAFGLRGSARIEWKRGGRLSRFVGAPGGFTIVPAGEENYFCMDRSLQTLNLVFGSPQLRALADREWKPYGPTIEIAPVHHQSAREIVALGQAFAGLLLAPAKVAACTPKLSGPRLRSTFSGTTRRCPARVRPGWNECPTLASGE